MTVPSRFAAALLVLLTGLLPACSPTPGDTGPVPEAATSTVTTEATLPPAEPASSASTKLSVPTHPGVVLPDGTSIALELAVTPEEHAQGLMFRPELPEQRGMLFLFAEPAYPRFWMKNTWTPLDIVFLDGHGTVLSVVRDAPPCREEPCPEYAPQHVTSAVLEVRAGTAARHGIEDGVTLRFDHVPGYPTHEAG